MISDHSNQNSPDQEAEQTLTLSGLSVLVVDDDADTRDLLIFLLGEYGAQVTAVTSAMEALAAFDQSTPDVLLSDIGMPGIDGYQLIQQIKDRLSDQAGQVLAIALTAYAGETDHQQALAAGFQYHLTKPIEPAMLVEVIARSVKVDVNLTTPEFPST